MTGTRRSWLETWRRRLRTLAADAVPADPAARAELVRTFRDERGHRRPIDELVLRWVTRLGTPEPPPDRPETAAGDSPDIRTWRALVKNAPLPSANDRTGPRPITDPDDNTAIEIWTETELACLHAMWWHARRAHDGTDRLRRTIADAVRWHLDTLQPDNATNHAWAVHVFVDAAWPEGGELDHEADLHAQGLVHAACYTTGRPDALSAILIHDAADAIELMLAETDGDTPA